MGGDVVFCNVMSSTMESFVKSKERGLMSNSESFTSVLKSYFVLVLTVNVYGIYC